MSPEIWNGQSRFPRQHFRLSRGFSSSSHLFSGAAKPPRRVTGAAPPTTPRAATTWSAAAPKARPKPKPSVASSATSHESSTHPPTTTTCLTAPRSINLRACLTPDCSNFADGRELAWIEYGAVDGSPVMAFHGSGGTRHYFAEPGGCRGAKGRSTHRARPARLRSQHVRPRRTYETWTRDIDQLADHLGLDRFGYSATPPVARTPRRARGSSAIGSSAVRSVSGTAPPHANVAEQGTFRVNRMPATSLRRLLQDSRPSCSAAGVATGAACARQGAPPDGIPHLPRL